MTDAQKTVNKALKAMASNNLSAVMAATLITINNNPRADSLAMQKKLDLKRTALNNRMAKLGAGSKGKVGLGLIAVATGRHTGKGNALGVILTPKGKSVLKQLAAL